MASARSLARRALHRRVAREDRIDVEIAERVLAEIAADPSRLIGGEELRIALEKLLAAE